ncbi:MAG: sugar phosphate isomerase/epimerase [Chitinophagaceae bacterium]|nr:sugar phosphate isomerase/epimerase [Chitinophagaceae bacterium]
MKPCIAFLLFCCLLCANGYSQEIKNPFFTLYNIISGDPTYNTVEKQIKFVKETGYDGIEINEPENFEAVKSALDKLNFPGAYFYFMVDIDLPTLDDRLKAYISQLRGTNVILAPYIKSGSNKSVSPSPETDAKVVKLLRRLSKWAARKHLQIAVYPHFGFYAARTDRTLELVKQVNRKNVGMSFNLCHWLATTKGEERNMLQPVLKDIMPYLKMVTISGANDVISKKKFIWDDYIMPLGKGSFDTYKMVDYIVKDLHYKGPIGVQCYGLKVDKVWLVKYTMESWNNYKVKSKSTITDHSVAIPAIFTTGASLKEIK